MAASLAPSVAEANGRLTSTTESGDVGELDLIEERLTITIDRQYADTTLRQVYANHSESPLEGRYTLQAGPGAKVHAFFYYNGEARIVGEVLKLSTATEIYEEVTGLGGDPGLLTESGEGAFTVRVFPILPGEDKPVEVDYHRRLERSGDRVLDNFPLADPTAAANATITLHDKRGITDLKSTSHNLNIKRIDPNHIEVRTKTPKGKPTELNLSWTIGACPPGPSPPPSTATRAKTATCCSPSPPPTRPFHEAHRRRRHPLSSTSPAAWPAPHSTKPSAPPSTS